MKTKPMLIQSALAVGALALAYVTWQRPAPGAPDTIVVIDASKNDVQVIRYQTKGRMYEIRRDDSSRAEPVAWVYQKPLPTEAKPPADPAAGAADAGAQAQLPAGHPQVDAPPIREQLLLANKEGFGLLEKFAPLRGTRSLGVLPPEKLKELGLEKPSKRLTVITRKGERSFEIGDLAVGATQNYLKDLQDNRVYLLANVNTNDFDVMEHRFVDRRLHDFNLKDVSELTLKSANRQRELIADQSTPGQVKLAPKNAPDKPDEFARNWHDKLWRLLPTELFGKDEALPGGEPTLKFRIDYLSKGKPYGHLEVATDKSGGYLGRTEHTAGWVKLPDTVQDLIKEADKIVAGS